MSQFPHYFIAIPLPSAIKKWLLNQQNKIKEKNNLFYKQWTHPDDFHITIKFLGPVSDDKVDQLSERLMQGQIISPFSLQLGGTGIFGNPKQPRVLWTGVEKSENLNQLYQFVEEACTKVGFPNDKRPYRPHITLAKKWNGEKTNVNDLNDHLKNFTDTNILTVDNFVIYQIYPSRIPKYEVIKSFKL